MIFARVLRGMGGQVALPSPHGSADLGFVPRRTHAKTTLPLRSRHIVRFRSVGHFHSVGERPAFGVARRSVLGDLAGCKTRQRFTTPPRILTMCLNLGEAPGDT